MTVTQGHRPMKPSPVPHSANKPQSAVAPTTTAAAAPHHSASKQTTPRTETAVVRRSRVRKDVTPQGLHEGQEVVPSVVQARDEVVSIAVPVAGDNRILTGVSLHPVLLNNTNSIIYRGKHSPRPRCRRSDTNHPIIKQPRPRRTTQKDGSWNRQSQMLPDYSNTVST